ncbi:expressed unknown protein [Seminavis robusta]|uniref:Uncharacterized protein n=1 Tax=Seminavis robusta TaxID=568900 RepID=A0A9N8ELK3_9STRA|nr:expressed unknown protein [Seminavis robusta]|eukprot:Sro1419_g271060.2  (234) ;mRNA; r:6113-6814
MALSTPRITTCSFRRLACFSFLVAVRTTTAFLPSSPRCPKTPTQLQESETNNRSKNKPMLNFMDKPVVNSVGDNPRPESVPIQDDPSAELVRAIAKAADGRKAENIVALRVSPVSTMASFLIILSGNSRPQNQAIAAAIRKDVQEQFEMLPMGNGVPEGSAESGWMLLDYGEVMVHVMTPKSRLYYNIEGQWRDKGGVEMDLSDVILPNVVESSAVMEGTMDIEDEQDDPFWS